MPNLNLDLDYFSHPKTVRLVGIIGDGADIYPIRLWAYCGKYHVADGVLKGYSKGEIEGALGWRGKGGELVDALLKVGYLDKNRETYSVHEFVDHEGHLLAFHERAKQANKARWDKIRGQKTSDPSRTPKAEVKESPVPIRTVPDLTVPKKEEPLSTPVDPPPPSEVSKVQNHKTPPEALRTAWNLEAVKLPKCLGLSELRRRKSAARLSERTLEEWAALFRRMNATPFLCGENDRGWKSSFDWIIQSQDNAVKVLEGKYDKAETPDQKARRILKIGQA